LLGRCGLQVLNCLFTPLKSRLVCFTPLIFDSSKLTPRSFRGVADSSN
jgi:hypothetical protein